MTLQTHKTKPPIALCCAGVDPSGGAGVLADLRVLSRLDVWGMALATALTAQNSVGVTAVHPVDPEIFIQQYQSLKEDFCIQGVKIGMLGGLAQAKQVTALLSEQPGPKVMDPVLISSSGSVLLAPEAFEYVREVLLPTVDLITPNLAEAEALSGLPVTDIGQMKDAARCLVNQFGVQAVLIKGGHLSGEPVDYYYGPEGECEFSGRRVEGVDPHGTGCLLSTAILGYKLQGCSWHQAIKQAKQFGFEAISNSFDLGHGKAYWT